MGIASSAGNVHKAHLLYKIIALRDQKRSAELVTNVDFDKWGDYLPDGPSPWPSSTVSSKEPSSSKFQGRSYRAHRPKVRRNAAPANYAKAREKKRIC